MSPLRRRMIDDMQIRNLSANTQRVYVAKVFRFACHFRKSPEHLGPAEIRDVSDPPDAGETPLGQLDRCHGVPPFGFSTPSPSSGHGLSRRYPHQPYRRKSFPS